MRRSVIAWALAGLLPIGLMALATASSARAAELSGSDMLSEVETFGAISVAAPRCGVRDKIWATRLVGHILSAINALDPDELSQEANLQPEDLEDALNKSQEDAVASYESDQSALCDQAVGDDVLNAADQVVNDQTPLW